MRCSHLLLQVCPIAENRSKANLYASTLGVIDLKSLYLSMSQGKRDMWPFLQLQMHFTSFGIRDNTKGTLESHTMGFERGLLLTVEEIDR